MFLIPGLGLLKKLLRSPLSSYLPSARLNISSVQDKRLHTLPYVDGELETLIGIRRTKEIFWFRNEMADPVVGSKFVSVTLNKSYGQYSNSSRPSRVWSGGGHGGVGSGMEESSTINSFVYKMHL